MFECVINVSEGKDEAVLTTLEHAAGQSFVNRHSDPFHHRSVFTLINNDVALTADVRAVARETCERLDVRAHEGAHPRFGVLDVVPFVALDERQRPHARQLRDETAAWLGSELGVSVFLYGDVNGVERTLPQVRKESFVTRQPDFGPADPNPRLGASAVGERPVLMAWNMWIRGLSYDELKVVAASLRSPQLRTLALVVGSRLQLSCNLIDPRGLGPHEVVARTRDALGNQGEVEGCELVGLCPDEVYEVTPPSERAFLDLDANRTISAARNRVR